MTADEILQAFNEEVGTLTYVERTMIESYYALHKDWGLAIACWLLYSRPCTDRLKRWVTLLPGENPAGVN